MKALVFENKVIQIEEKEFPVHKDLQWIDVGDKKIDVGYDYIKGEFIAPPVHVPDYRELRRNKYLPIPEQLDLMYWDLVNGTNMWKQHITKIKTDIPKA